MMYYLVYGLLYLFSLLPFWFVYLISDFFYFIIYRVWGYRKEIVLSNLSIAFPEKSLPEKQKIAKQFYKNLVDNFIETIKLLSISEKEIKRRINWNEESLNKYFASGRNVQLHLGHFFNWEYGNAILGIKSIYPALTVYMPIVNKVVDKLFINLRTRFNTKLIAATHFKKDFAPYLRSKYCLVFVADQNPGKVSINYWSNFMHRKTPFVTGPEKTAKLTNNIVMYVEISRLKRGFYHADFFNITTEPRTLKEGEITKIFIDYVEQTIRKYPAEYLWSHRRWKHTFNAEKHSALFIK